MAERLGIAHYVIDMESRFREAVIDDFVDSYVAGETPVPCVRCNETVKFGDLMAAAIDMGAEALAQKAAERPFNFCDVVDPMPLGFARLEEGTVLHAAGRRWQVRLGQGHAPDHATLWSLDDHLVLGGDQFLATITPNIGVYATEPDADPLSEWLTSCRRFQPLVRPDQLILPGHKLPFTGLPQRLTQKIASHEAALARLLDHLSSPIRAVDCFSALYRRSLGPEDFGLALAETLAHLNCLHRQGQITRTLLSDGAWGWQRR